jgi:hypothetical protein
VRRNVYRLSDLLVSARTKIYYDDISERWNFYFKNINYSREKDKWWILIRVSLIFNFGCYLLEPGLWRDNDNNVRVCDLWCVLECQLSRNENNKTPNVFSSDLWLERRNNWENKVRLKKVKNIDFFCYNDINMKLLIWIFLLVMAIVYFVTKWVLPCQPNFFYTHETKIELKFIEFTLNQMTTIAQYFDTLS